MTAHSPKPMLKPTTADIARAARVSLATVDRVLNGRAGVRGVTIKKVRHAIAELGYVRDTAAANLARRRVYSLLFIVPDIDNAFVQALRDEIAVQGGALAHERTALRCETVPPFDPNAIAARLDRLEAGTTDGVAIFGPDAPQVSAAIARAKSRGIAVVALVGDLPGSERDHFVGIDNVAAGRTAGQLMGRFARKPGNILVITGSDLARDHNDRRVGFAQVLTSQHTHLNIADTIEGRDDPELIFQRLNSAAARHPNLTGIYAAAAGTAGVIRFLQACPHSDDLTVIAHELTPLSRAGLENRQLDALISQNTGHLVRSSVRLLKATADGIPINALQERIRIDIYLRENLPAE